jgi:hypothetical protein
LPAGAKVTKTPAAYNKNMIAMQRNDSVPDRQPFQSKQYKLACLERQHELGTASGQK